MAAGQEEQKKTAVPAGNWKTMTFDEAKKLGLHDLVGIWLTPPLKSGRKGLCPNCRRENMTLASYGICSRCRAAVVDRNDGKIRKTGIAMLAALAARAAELGCEQAAGELESPQNDAVEPVPEKVAAEPLTDGVCAEPPVETAAVAPDLSAVEGRQSGFDAADDVLWKFLVLPGYESLAGIMQEAMDQAQLGKGAERHAGVGEPFDEQLICAITRRVGLGFPLGQAIKKAVESKRLGGEAGRREILGAINYLSAAVICGREGVV